ncbi:hypothetical protein EON67_02655 [archaeon]|nr:MAG: hypothetical protein EON67_02655 [archaeon]
MYACARARVCVYVFVCIRVCVCVCVYACASACTSVNADHSARPYVSCTTYTLLAAQQTRTASMLVHCAMPVTT